MYGQDLFISTLIKLNLNSEPSDQPSVFAGGLFLDHETICPSFISLISSNTEKGRSSCFSRKTLSFVDRRRGKNEKRSGGLFLSVSLSIKEEEESYVGESKEENAAFIVEEKKKRSGSAAFNTTKHLWAGAVAAMVSRC